MDIRGLGYIGLDVADSAAWRSYADLLGTMVVTTASNDSFRIKIDDRPHRCRPPARWDHFRGVAPARWDRGCAR